LNRSESHAEAPIESTVSTSPCIYGGNSI
jgi:hypothetical protein